MNKASELYLRIPADQIAAAGAGAIALKGAVPAVFLLTGAGRVPPEILRAFIAWARSQNAAVLIENDACAVKELDADGVHLRANSEPLQDVRALLGKDKVIGVSCALSRHEAMEMAEAGADYIAFGEGAAGDPGDVAAMIRWWEEIFEVPCVAWVRDEHDGNDIGTLRDAGADFLALPGLCSLKPGVFEIGVPDA